MDLDGVEIEDVFNREEGVEEIPAEIDMSELTRLGIPPGYWGLRTLTPHPPEKSFPYIRFFKEGKHSTGKRSKTKSKRRK